MDGHPATEQVVCGICGRERERKSCKVVELTDEERQAIEDSGQEPDDEYIYCKPCWRTLTDRQTAPAFMVGILQVRLRLAGVSNAEQIATAYHKRLLKMIDDKK